MKRILIILTVTFIISCQQEPKPVKPLSIVPTAQQMAYQKMEQIGFIHFGVNTFMDKEWGYGDEDPAIFNPLDLDTEQWARTAKEAGLKQLILTAKHHDGFCLWPSKFTEHSVKNSPWKNGKGDLVREFVDACNKYGLKAGLYLSPWDRNHAEYGRDAYVKYYHNQLREILSNYGEISEVWFDGANGGDGYYGGARENRKIDRDKYYQWDTITHIVRKLQPNAVIFSDKGDVRWIGNENGYAGETNWSLIQPDKLKIGGSNQQAYLNSGDEKGTTWSVGECDVSIRPGWFYHENQDSLVKSLDDLKKIYFASVGRNGTLLINIPPGKNGLWHQNDVDRLIEFGEFIEGNFKENLVFGNNIQADNYRGKHIKYHPKNIFDEDTETYWATDDNITAASVEIDLGKPVTFNTIMIQEYIKLGQRVKSFTIEAFIDDVWVKISEGTTIGYKRILQTSEIKTDKVRFKILDAKACPIISNFALFNINQ
ncbi:MAG: alpha-L-fucosidase [Bacteroidota bacterium]